MNTVKCRTTRILMMDYIDGNLAAEDNSLISAHLQECAACRKDYRQTLDMIDLLKDIPVTPASAGFVDRSLSNAVRSQPATAGSRIKYVAGGIAAVLIALVVTLSLVMGPDSEQSDSTVVLIGNQVKTIKVIVFYRFSNQRQLVLLVSQLRKIPKRTKDSRQVSESLPITPWKLAC